MLEACAWRCICSMASTLKKLALQAGVRIQGTMHSSRTGWKRRLLWPCACACGAGSHISGRHTAAAPLRSKRLMALRVYKHK